jgi:hypothetical protein
MQIPSRVSFVGQKLATKNDEKNVSVSKNLIVQVQTSAYRVE